MRRWAVLLLLPCALPCLGQTLLTSLATGQSPVALAINASTNKIYVVNQGSNSVTVIDGGSGKTVDLSVDAYPTAVAVNAVTDKIYVTNFSGHSVSVIDGATNGVASVAVAASPKAVAVNSVTDKIYVSNTQSNLATIIDGATNLTATVPVGPLPGAIAVNEQTDTIYVANTGNGTLTIIDGGTNQTQQVAVGPNPVAIAVSVPTNIIYVVNENSSGSSGTVAVVDGISNTVTTLAAGLYPLAVAVNPSSNKIYVANAGDGTVTVIDGATNNTTTLPVGSYPSAVAVNPLTNKIYIANCLWYGTATMIDGMTNAITTVDTGVYSNAVAVNPETNQVYVANLGSNNVSIIAGAAPPALQFVPITPCRVADTRLQNGPLGGPTLESGVARSFPVASGACGVGPQAAAYSVNVTVVPHGVLSYLTVWPTGVDQPLVSTMNSLDGRTKANAAIVPAGAGGAISMFSRGTTDIVLDIDGYFVPEAEDPALAFYPLAPCRLIDTRGANGPLAGPYLEGQQARSFPLQQSPCNLPSGAMAYALNFTVVPHGALGYLTAWPTGESQPLVSTLNALTGAITANGAIVPAGVAGAVSVYVSNDTDLVVDVSGYFAEPGPGGLAFYPVAPWRMLDTRKGNGLFSGTLKVDVVDNSWGIPSNAQAFVVNATVVPQSILGYLTLWADGGQQPLASILNALDGAITSNMAIVPSGNGWIDAGASSPTQLVLDISGYFAP